MRVRVLWEGCVAKHFCGECETWRGSRRHHFSCNAAVDLPGLVHIIAHISLSVSVSLCQTTCTLHPDTVHA